MDPINPVAGNPEALNQMPKVQDPERAGRVERDNHGITIAAMAIFVLFALGAVAFLYFQNQQLKNLLASYQTPAVSPTPAATNDPTANWKTYNDPSFSFKYPGKETLVNKLPAKPDSSKVYLLVDKELSFNAKTLPVCSSTNTDSATCILSAHAGETTPEITEVKVDNAVALSFRVSIPSSPPNGTIILKIVQIKSPAIELAYSVDASGLEQTFQQILSTFKFLGSTASPSGSPVACTLEAKICPNGSSVGRTGPNCEFAPCPTY